LIAEKYRAYLGAVIKECTPEDSFWCISCDQPRTNCLSITKDRSTSYLCKECEPFLDEVIRVWPVALFAIRRMQRKNSTPPAVTELSRVEGKRLGFEKYPCDKYPCDKCDLVFTNREAKMRHIDEKHRI